jgi:DNA-binding GntR family transcriptional regulator
MHKLYLKLRDDIIMGQFNPGEHLAEKLLTKKYGVSRASVREIIGKLASQGYLKIEPNHGAIVPKLSVEDINTIYSILSRCESLAASLFSKTGNGRIINRLRLLQKKMETSKRKSGHKVWLKLNERFHELIYLNCGSSILADLISHNRLRIYRFRMAKTQPEKISIYNRQHKRILMAIIDGNAKLAEKMTLKHLETARKNRFSEMSEYLRVF